MFTNKSCQTYIQARRSLEFYDLVNLTSNQRK